MGSLGWSVLSIGGIRRPSKKGREGAFAAGVPGGQGALVGFQNTRTQGLGLPCICLRMWHRRTRPHFRLFAALPGAYCILTAAYYSGVSKNNKKGS